MKTNISLLSTNEPDRATTEHLQNNLGRRDGSIRGIMLNAKRVNFERAIGLTKPPEEFLS